MNKTFYSWHAYIVRLPAGVCKIDNEDEGRAKRRLEIGFADPSFLGRLVGDYLGVALCDQLA